MNRTIKYNIPVMNDILMYKINTFKDMSSKNIFHSISSIEKPFDHLSKRYTGNRTEKTNLLHDLNKIKEMSVKMNKNYNKRLNEIKHIINKKVTKKVTKKYMIKNIYMYHRLVEYINENNINVNYSYLISNQKNQPNVKRLFSIEDSRSLNYCQEIWNMDYYHDNVPSEYIKIEYLI